MPSIFKKRLDKINPQSGRRRWIYMPYDQVTDRLGPLKDEPENMGLILIENAGKAARRPYHKQKLALILANLRHFALEQAKRGVAVRHVATQSGLYSTALAELAAELGPIELMEPAERELRAELAPLIESGAIKLLPHEGWLTELSDLEAIKAKDGTYRMDSFYRRVRQKSGILMEGGKPIGGKYSFDAENRQPWKGEPLPPSSPTFEVDDITEEVGALIEKHMSYHPGVLDLEHLPATQADHDRLWSFALEHCLPLFGPFEDAMSTRSRGLFHSRISASLNIHRITPKQLIEDVLSLDIPLASQEGFVRQVLGWREFVHKIHLATDGFRTMSPVRDKPGDGGYGLWSGQSFTDLAPTALKTDCSSKNPDGGACPSFFGGDNPVPPAFWGKTSGLNCLDTVVKSVWDEAYSHHITRLMVLSNLATLLDISPRELTDWFWVAYFDAYDWVVEPNVLAMGTYSLGGLMTTKPYISGSAYINKMSDYCKSCRFDPAKNCPVTRLYWAFLDRHQEKLANNIRLAMPLNSLKKRADSEREKDRQIFNQTIKRLLAAQELH
jgi:deoxyribodipyrimidine photolyase-related protein